MDTWTDSELVREARQGGKAAFGVLIERYTPMVFRLVRRRIGHTEVAHDLTQETLLQAFLSLDHLQSEASFRSWLYGITLNVCRVYLRSLRQGVLSLDAMPGGIARAAEHGPTPEEIAERVELRRALTQAIATLSPARRAAVQLVYFEEFSLQEAANILGISLTALKGRLHKARLQLKAGLLSPNQTALVKQGVSPMIPVKIVDVRRKEEASDTGTPVVWMQVVLFDEVEHRAVVIWVGEPEGTAIANGLLKHEAPRPMTPLFTARLLRAAGAAVEHVLISSLKSETFYATVRVRAGDRVQEVDARPSDALALALQMDTPIYVSAGVMEQAGNAISADQSPTGKGIADLQARLAAQAGQWEKCRAIQREGRSDEQAAQDLARETSDILADAFGVT